MIKTGIIINISNKKAGIMTSSGEFVYIKIGKVFPKVGQIHTGELYKKNLFLYKYAITAASLMFILLPSTYAYTYYSPVTTIVVTINPSISIKANKWDKIISSKALNSEGSLILNNIKLKNKSIDDGLELLVKEAKTEHFINDKYVDDKKIISVDIKSKKDNSIDISNFKNVIDSNKLIFKINATSSNNKSIDITVNNKKIDISNLNPIVVEKENINKELKNKSNHILKPSVDNNISDKKSSKVEAQLKNNTNSTMDKDNEAGKDRLLKNKNSKDNNNNNNNSNNNDSSSIKNYNPLDNFKNSIQDEKHEYNIKSKIPNDDKYEKDSYEIQKKHNSLDH
ncbi:MAG: hypothetical protein ACI8WT_001443 [Clostridium sp.]|jgi:hypothetical protein